MGEARFSHQAIRDDATGDASFGSIRLQVCSGGLAVFFDEVSRRIGPTKLMGKGLIAQSLNFLKFFLALQELVLGLKLQGGV